MLGLRERMEENGSAPGTGEAKRSAAAPADPEVVDRPLRRRFSVADRFERERLCLSPPAPWPYRPVVPRPEPRTTGTRPPSALQVVEVEGRPLSEYAEITGQIS